MLTRKAITALAAVSLLCAAPAAVVDEPDIDVGGCSTEWICAEVGTGGKPGGRPSGSGGGSGAGSSAGGKPSGAGSSKPPNFMPCEIRKLDPQPGPGSDLWEGHKPGDGAIYVNTCASSGMGEGTDGAVGLAFWAADQPPPGVPPEVLAQRAVDQMLLKGPAIGITPKPGGRGVVGMPVYLWTEKGPETYGPNTASASAGGITVTATAKVSRIVWQMGDGKTVTCTTAGTPYKAAYGKKPSPDCGHRYEAPSSTTGSGTYHVTATSTWTIGWEATSGQSGQLTEVRDSAVDITVAEVQVLN
ncbi:ATP/GTP-binding protein [Streptomyces sp. NPDC059780]|uniref:ATP/GTP-binding protein n=1 Tax=Streptomyces sp. NPDC059780 TaxID=3346942 RepID=UPI000AE9D3F7